MPLATACVTRKRMSREYAIATSGHGESHSRPAPESQTDSQFQQNALRAHPGSSDSR
jgi:hypothetical protein